MSEYDYTMTMNKYEYTIEMNFYTDGDYGWDLVPAGFNYDNNYEYSYKNTFYSYENLKSWCEKAIPVLKSKFNLYGDDDITSEIIKKLNNFMEVIQNNSDYYFDELSGNYEGTFIKLSKEKIGMKFYLKLDTELINKITSYKITEDDIIKLLEDECERRKNNIVGADEKGL